MQHIVKSGNTPSETEKWQCLAHKAARLHLTRLGVHPGRASLRPQPGPGLNGALLGLCANWPR